MNKLLLTLSIFILILISSESFAYDCNTMKSTCLATSPYVSIDSSPLREDRLVVRFPEVHGKVKDTVDPSKNYVFVNYRCGLTGPSSSGCIDYSDTAREKIKINRDGTFKVNSKKITLKEGVTGGAVMNISLQVRKNNPKDCLDTVVYSIYDTSGDQIMFDHSLINYDNLYYNYLLEVTKTLAR